MRRSRIDPVGAVARVVIRCVLILIDTIGSAVLLAFHALEKSVRAYYSFKRWLIGLTQQKNRSHRRFSEPQSAVLERSPLLRLPSELRLRIYELALQTDTNANGRSGCILQLGVGLRGMYLVRCAPYPSSWHAFQHVRSDDDSPSKTLPYILALGGSAKDPFVAPPNRGCVHYGRNESLICGDMSCSLGWQNANRGEAFCRFTSLICVCRTFYCEVLPILYAQNTISFFGADMVLFFIRNVGADGLAMVRNVHLALHLEATRWIDVRKKQKVLKTVQCLEKRFVGLKQLDVEVIITWGQPTDADLLWKWVMQEVFAPLGCLDEFVLKVSVALPLSEPARNRIGYNGWQPELESLSSWSSDDYQSLKLALTREPHNTLNTSTGSMRREV